MLTDNRKHICDVQGELFVLASRKGLKSSEFIRKFMKSEVAQFIDELDEDPYAYSHNPQKAADVPLNMTAEDIMAKLLEEEKISKASSQAECYPEEVMRWAGSLYRYWHYFDRCRPSIKIWRKANGQTMKRSFEQLHELEPEDAIEKLLDAAMHDLWTRA